MVQKAIFNDRHILAEMAVQMWDTHTINELEKDFEEKLKSENVVFFIKYADGVPVGFCQCGLRRDYVEGTKSTPVGYLEGIFVKEGYQNKGYAKDLLSACEKWARNKGCREFASDCELDNINSLNFHVSMGFDEVNRIICFRKNI